MQAWWWSWALNETNSPESGRQCRNGAGHEHPKRTAHLRVADNAGMVVVMRTAHMRMANNGGSHGCLIRTAHLRVADNAGMLVANVNEMMRAKMKRNTTRSWQPVLHLPSKAMYGSRSRKARSAELSGPATQPQFSYTCHKHSNATSTLCHNTLSACVAFIFQRCDMQNIIFAQVLQRINWCN